ncbi:hypothetical protein PPERSA_01678 [Pseudocohnilembus persalinus]|uniref:Uncharacterized protein n=1 Tax=Pseudocohnilembus persalinus TaxID=266149 RepID=A0A0V0R1V7_PSEPJ|nr:hypothetical protein PPERSA_01678 [Pseudocohnilembus persalinus]|eukprot:KRX08133.1 hypothetical protein PPERSA_01678 [Pseudocohnilembus persalinus]
MTEVYAEQQQLFKIQGLIEQKIKKLKNLEREQQQQQNTEICQKEDEEQKIQNNKNNSAQKQKADQNNDINKNEIQCEEIKNQLQQLQNQQEIIQYIIQEWKQIMDAKQLVNINNFKKIKNQTQIQQDDEEDGQFEILREEEEQLDDILEKIDILYEKSCQLIKLEKLDLDFQQQKWYSQFWYEKYLNQEQTSYILQQQKFQGQSIYQLQQEKLNEQKRIQMEILNSQIQQQHLNSLSEQNFYNQQFQQSAQKKGQNSNLNYQNISNQDKKKEEYDSLNEYYSYLEEENQQYQNQIMLQQQHLQQGERIKRQYNFQYRNSYKNGAPNNSEITQFKQQYYLYNIDTSQYSLQNEIDLLEQELVNINEDNKKNIYEDKTQEKYFEYDELNKMNYEHYNRVSGPAFQDIQIQYLLGIIQLLEVKQIAESISGILQCQPKSQQLLNLENQTTIINEQKGGQGGKGGPNYQNIKQQQQEEKEEQDYYDYYSQNLKSQNSTGDQSDKMKIQQKFELDQFQNQDLVKDDVNEIKKQAFFYEYQSFHTSQSEFIQRIYKKITEQFQNQKKDEDKIDYMYLLKFDESINPKNKWVTEQDMLFYNYFRDQSLFSCYNVSQKTFVQFGHIQKTKNQKNKLQNLKIEEILQKMQNYNASNQNKFVSTEMNNYQMCHHCKQFIQSKHLVKCNYSSQKYGLPILNQQVPDPFLSYHLDLDAIPKKLKYGSNQAYIFQNNDYICLRQFCKTCLKTNYDVNLQEIDLHDFLCPVCNGTCFCSRCLRQDMISKIKGMYILLGGELSLLYLGTKTEEFLRPQIYEEIQKKYEEEIGSKNLSQKMQKLQNPKTIQKMKQVKGDLEQLQLLSFSVRRREKIKNEQLKTQILLFQKKCEQILGHEFESEDPDLQFNYQFQSDQILQGKQIFQKNNNKTQNKDNNLDFLYNLSEIQRKQSQLQVQVDSQSLLIQQQQIKQQQQEQQQQQIEQQQMFQSQSLLQQQDETQHSQNQEKSNLNQDSEIMDKNQEKSSENLERGRKKIKNSYINIQSYKDQRYEEMQIQNEQNMKNKKKKSKLNKSQLKQKIKNNQLQNKQQLTNQQQEIGRKIQ